MEEDGGGVWVEEGNESTDREKTLRLTGPSGLRMRGFDWRCGQFWS